jgi:hypothetical protein
MLYDRRWDTTVVPEIKMEPWQEILLEAVAILEKYGWQQGTMGDKRAGFCALGAISQAGEIDEYGFSGHSPAHYEAACKLSSMVGHIPTWNDNGIRTKEEVIAVLRRVATT